MFTSILVFIAVLSVLILVHEIGHFYAAKRSGVLVEEFGFGLPPRVIGKKVGETIYSLNLLPFGGFVRLHGESKEEEIDKPKRAFLNKSAKQRTLIVTAGVIMNFLLALFSFSVFYSFVGVPRETGEVKVVEVREDSPAAEAGLINEDIVRRVDEKEVGKTREFIGAVDEKKGQEVALTIERNGERRETSVVPRENPPEGEGALGVVITSSENFYPPLWQRPFYGIYFGIKEALFWTGIVIGGFVTIFAQLFQGTVPEGIAGPVGIYAITSEVAAAGLLPLINFVGVLSVNLAILNIIPFPPLDGGRLLFIGIEKTFGRKILPKVEAVVHAVGMIILLLLVLAITFHDIQRLISAGGVSGFVEDVLR